MVRINCHSGYKHYEMFHNNCGGSNYGSVFNTTYNINCGGHSGGFWGGFGAGIGNAFGSIFGGMFGGGMGNFGFGNFGMGGFGNFGMGGLTMPWFNSMGNFGWGGGNVGGANGTNSNNSSNSSNGAVDKDNALYNTYKKQVDNAIKDDDAKSAKKLYDKIKKSHEKPEDPLNENMNKGAYHDLMTTLENKFPELKDGTDAAKDKKPDNDGKAAPKASTTGKQEVIAPPKADKDAEAKKAEEAIANAGSLDDLRNVDYNKLTAEEKEKYINKAIELAKSNDTTPAALREALKGMPDEVRVKVKQSFYKDGFSNVDIKDLNTETLKNLIEVIDVSDAIPDFKNIKVGTPTKSGDNLWTIPMTSKNGGTHVNYIQVSINTEDGEIIFHGKQDNQKYVLQKDTNNKLHLMQYKYHEGYDEADVKAK